MAKQKKVFVVIKQEDGSNLPYADVYSTRARAEEVAKQFIEDHSGESEEGDPEVDITAWDDSEGGGVGDGAFVYVVESEIDGE
jgi:hypothetical protein